MFNLMLAHDLKSTQIDFRNAFVQSTLPEPIYIQSPPGFKDFRKKDHYPKVIKSLYGDRRAPQLWFKHQQGTLFGDGRHRRQQATVTATRLSAAVGSSVGREED
jgi:hypothetical protein